MLRSLLGSHALFASGDGHFDDWVEVKVPEDTSADEIDILKKGEVVHSSVPYLYPTDVKVTASCMPVHFCESA